MLADPIILLLEDLIGPIPIEIPTAVRNTSSSSPYGVSEVQLGLS